jgi:hypothetical protein
MADTGLASPCKRCPEPVDPYRIDPDPGGCRAWYLHCGKRWSRGWALTPVEMAEYEDAAA